MKIVHLAVLLVVVAAVTYSHAPQDEKDVRPIGDIIRSRAPKAIVHRDPAPPLADTPAKRFKRDANLPFLYISFDHIGSGTRFSEDEPARRVWLRVVNNCVVPITLRTFGPPEGISTQEVGLIHDVVVDEGGSATGDGAAKRQADRCKQATVPPGYVADASSVTDVEPGETILFSVPVTHLSRCWHLEIPFEFSLPQGRGPRNPINGGEPVMRLHYSAWDLPISIQEQLRNPSAITTSSSE